MHGNLSASARSAIFPGDTGVADATDLSGDGWFAEIAQRFYPHKPGAALHHLTDCGERNGQRYTATSAPVQPPGTLIRDLLRSDHGLQWLRALMQGCEATWWLDLERDLRLAEVAQRFAAEVQNLK